MGTQKGDRRLRVAIAEDEPFTLAYLDETISVLGHEVVARAADGAQLVEQCRAQRPDLVFTDINMPVLDGLQAARQLCRDMQAPVVVITGYDFISETAQAAQECPILLYLVKPVTSKDLESAIRAAMLRFDQLRECLEDEVDIQAAFADWRRVESAKAILMRAMKMNERQAFEHLRRLAREHGQALLDAAETVLGHPAP